MEELEKSGLYIELEDLEKYGIYSSEDELEARGIKRLDNGNFEVKFTTEFLLGGDLKFLVALWGISSCSASQPCPWCLIDSKYFGTLDMFAPHRY